MSSPRQTLSRKAEITTKNYKDLSTKTKNCATFKPNMPAAPTVTNSDTVAPVSSKLSSTVATSLQTVLLPTKKQQQSCCTNSYFKSNAFSTSSKIKFCKAALILLIVIVVQSSQALPTPTAGSRLLLHTPHHRQQRHQQLLQQQRSLVLPTPHRPLHHRPVANMNQLEQNSEDENNGSEVSDQCQILSRLEDRIQGALRQANATFLYINNQLKLYTAAQHNDTPQNFYEQWKKHSLELNHPYAGHIKNIRDINIMPEHITSDMIHLWNKPLTATLLQTEFQQINQTLRSIEKIYDLVIKDRDTNKEAVFHDLRRGTEPSEKTRERADIIQKFFNKVHSNLKQDLYYTGQIMEELDVPKIDVIPYTYKPSTQHLEWQLFQEHLAFMKYLVAMYTYILQKC